MVERVYVPLRIFALCFYKNEKRQYGFSMLKGLKKYYIDTVEQYYVPFEDEY